MLSVCLIYVQMFLYKRLKTTIKKLTFLLQIINHLEKSNNKLTNLLIVKNIFNLQYVSYLIDVWQSLIINNSQLITKAKPLVRVTDRHKYGRLLFVILFQIVQILF
jgi:hypothetical protein